MRYRIVYRAPGVLPRGTRREEYSSRDKAMARAVELSRAGYMVEVYPVYPRPNGREWRGTPLRLEPRPA